MQNSILIVDGVGYLLLSRKLVWFTDDGICGEGYMICTLGKFQLLYFPCSYLYRMSYNSVQIGYKLSSNCIVDESLVYSSCSVCCFSSVAANPNIK